MDSRQQQHPVASAAYYYSHHPHSYHDPALASLAYRPLQYPVQLGGLPSSAARHQQQLQQQHAHLSLAAAGFQQHQQPHHQPSFRPRHPHQVPLRTRQPSRQACAAMAYEQPPAAHGMTEEEMAELQKASNEYQPETTGPLVGERQPSTAITTEYASADPIFQAKTAALPQKYSHYRTVRGDGNCGWRAVAFGYFETLIHWGDPNKFYEELARLRSMSNVCSQAGFDVTIFQDFADETYELLKKLPQALSVGNAEGVLLETFSDDMVQNYIITHLRTLTAAWMKTRPNDYAPWLITQTVEEYTNSQILPVAAEIDNVGLTALKDVFLSPAGITLEVLYLDRSEGSEVNMHRFDPVNHIDDLGTVRLLYRPGHYDLLYMAQELPAASIPTSVETFLQYASHPHHEPVYDLGVSDFMTMIPGMSYATPHGAWMSGSTGYAGSDFFATSAPVQHCTQPLAVPAAPAPQPQTQSQPMYTATPTQLVPPPVQFPQELAIRTASNAGGTRNLSTFQSQSAGGPFRPSHWELEPDFLQATSSVPFQTAIFRNSPFNTAHFMNPDFQPEEWRPDDDYVTTSSKSSRHRNSG